MKGEQLPDTTYPADGRLRNNDRLTVITQIHHDHTGRPTFSGDVRFDRLLRTTEQPLHREIEIGEEPTQLETHWMKEVGYVLIHNITGSNFQIHPSKAEKEDNEKRIVKVTFGLDCVKGLLFPPGTGYPIEVEDITSVYLRSLYKKALVNVYLFPA
jgi:hypothetical protein